MSRNSSITFLKWAWPWTIWSFNHAARLWKKLWDFFLLFHRVFPKELYFSFWRSIKFPICFCQHQLLTLEIFHKNGVRLGSLMFVVFLKLLMRHLNGRSDLRFSLHIGHLLTEIFVLWRSILNFESLLKLRFTVSIWQFPLIKVHIFLNNCRGSNFVIYLTNFWNHLESILNIVLSMLRLLESSCR